MTGATGETGAATSKTDPVTERLNRGQLERPPAPPPWQTVKMRVFVPFTFNCISVLSILSRFLQPPRPSRPNQGTNSIIQVDELSTTGQQILGSGNANFRAFCGLLGHCIQHSSVVNNLLFRASTHIRTLMKCSRS